MTAKSYLLTRLVPILTCVFTLSSLAQAAVLFEGWSKVLINEAHKGFVVQRIEFDEGKKQFKSTHYLKASGDEADMVESLTAIADEKMNPVSFSYNGVIDKKPISVVASFTKETLAESKKSSQAQPSSKSQAALSKNPSAGAQAVGSPKLVMKAEVKEGDKKKTVSQVLPEGAFLSSFLGYVMLQGKGGISKGVRYNYNAVLEESAALVKGEAFVESDAPHKGIPAFRVLNTIQGAKYVAMITGKAEVLATQSPTQGVSTELVATRKEAEGPVKVKDSVLNELFGGQVPSGSQNELARRAGQKE